MRPCGVPVDVVIQTSVLAPQPLQQRSRQARVGKSDSQQLACLIYLACASRAVHSADPAAWHIGRAGV